MKKRVLSFILTLALMLVLLPATSVSPAIARITPTIPYELGEPGYHDNISLLEWVIPDEVISFVDILVVEYEGTIGNIGFVRYGFDEDFVVFWLGDNRITEEPGKLTFDMTGFGGILVGIFLDMEIYRSNVKRVYLDVQPNLSPYKAIYVDASNTEEGDGTLVNPFRDLRQAGRNAKSGDTIIVADGIYYGSVSVPSGEEGRPTVLMAAEGARPVITTTIPFNGPWTPYKDNIYVATIMLDFSSVFEDDKFLPQVFVDGVAMIEARWPNLPGTDKSVIMHQERVMAQEGTNLNTIVSSEDVPDDIEDAYVVIWAGHGEHLATSAIESVNGNTLNLASSIDHSQGMWPELFQPTAGNMFYITNSLSLLDAPGEYYFDRNSRRLYFYAPNGEDPTGLNITLKVDDDINAIMLGRHSYVTVDGFDIFGAGIHTEDSDNIIIQNCAIRYANHFNVYSGDAGYLHLGLNTNSILRNCEIGPTAAYGIGVFGENNIITNNVFFNCNYSGETKPGTAVILMAQSQSAEISFNTFINTGGSFINVGPWGGGKFIDTTIRNNHFINPMMLSAGHGSVFYTWDTDGSGTEIYNNFIEIEEHVNFGEFNRSAGISLDGGTTGYKVNHNIIKGPFNVGLAAGDQSSNEFYNNTIIGAVHGISPAETGVTFKDNLFVDIQDTDILHFGSSDNYVDDFIDGTIPVPSVISSGNARGTINEFFRPTDETPDIGAIPRGGEMFEYGATWLLGEVQDSDGIIPDDTNLNVVAPEPEPEPEPEAESTLGQVLSIFSDNMMLWIIIGAAVVLVVVLVVVIIVVRRKK